MTYQQRQKHQQWVRWVLHVKALGTPMPRFQCAAPGGCRTWSHEPAYPSDGKLAPGAVVTAYLQQGGYVLVDTGASATPTLAWMSLAELGPVAAAPPPPPPPPPPAQTPGAPPVVIQQQAPGDIVAPPPPPMGMGGSTAKCIEPAGCQARDDLGGIMGNPVGVVPNGAVVTVLMVQSGNARVAVDPAVAALVDNNPIVWVPFASLAAGTGTGQGLRAGTFPGMFDPNLVDIQLQPGIPQSGPGRCVNPGGCGSALLSCDPVDARAAIPYGASVMVHRREGAFAVITSPAYRYGQKSMLWVPWTDIRLDSDPKPNIPAPGRVAPIQQRPADVMYGAYIGPRPELDENVFGSSTGLVPGMPAPAGYYNPNLVSVQASPAIYTTGPGRCVNPNGCRMQNTCGDYFLPHGAPVTVHSRQGAMATVSSPSSPFPAVQFWLLASDIRLDSDPKPNIPAPGTTAASVQTRDASESLASALAWRRYEAAGQNCRPGVLLNTLYNQYVAAAMREGVRPRPPPPPPAHCPVKPGRIVFLPGPGFDDPVATGYYGYAG